MQKKTSWQKTGSALYRNLDPMHPPLAVVSATDAITSSWNSIWDEALEYGVRGTRLMQGLYGALAKPTFGNKACPRCNTYPEHLFTKHLTCYHHNISIILISYLIFYPWRLYIVLMMCILYILSQKRQSE